MDQDMSQLHYRYKLKPLSAPLFEASTGHPFEELDIVAGQVYTFGRSKSCCDVVFQDRRVSRKHCQLYLDPSGFKLFLLNGVTIPDLHLMSHSSNTDSSVMNLPAACSLNGVFVNGKTVEPGGYQILRHGAVVSFVTSTRGDQAQEDASSGPAIGFSIMEEDAADNSTDGFASSRMLATRDSEMDRQTVPRLHTMPPLHEQVSTANALVRQAGSALQHSIFASDKVDTSLQGALCAGKGRKKLERSLSGNVVLSSSNCEYVEHMKLQNPPHTVQEGCEGSCSDLLSNCDMTEILRKPSTHRSRGTKAVAANDHTRAAYSQSHCVYLDGEIIEMKGTYLPPSFGTRSAVIGNLTRANTDLLEPISKEDTSVGCDRVAAIPCHYLSKRKRLCGPAGHLQRSELDQRRHFECTPASGLATSWGTSLSTSSGSDAGKGPNSERKGKNEAVLKPMQQEVSSPRSISRSGPQVSLAHPGNHCPSPAVFLNKLHGVSEAMECNSISLAELLLPLDDLLGIFAATFTGDLEWFLSSNSIPAELPVTIACHNNERSWSLSKNDRFDVPLSNWPKLTVVYPPFPLICAIGKGKTGHTQGIGCHHPKLFLLQRKSSIRVIITSANLTSSQWSKVTNNIWKQDFPQSHRRSYETLFPHQSQPNCRNTHGDFAAQLAAFVSSLLVDVPSQLHWVVCLADYDFSDAEVTLVASIPGLHGHPYEPVTMEFLDPRQTVTAEQALGVVDTVVVGIANRFGPRSDSKGVKLRQLATAIHRQKEVEQGLIRVYLKRMPNIVADSNAVGVFIPERTDAGSSLLQKGQTQMGLPGSTLCARGTYMQLGFVPRDTAKWVAHLWDKGASIFAGYVSQKDVLTVASGLSSGYPQLSLHVYRSAKFSELLDECETPEHEAAVCCLLRSLKRPLGLWRLQQVLSTYEWPCSGETDFVYASSSIGTSVDAKFFAAFAAAAGRKIHGVDDVDSVDSDPQWGSWTVEQEMRRPSIGIVFPTIERAKGARGGIESHRGLHHFHENTWTRLKPAGLLHDAVPFPASREGFPMHVKVARRCFQNESEAPYGWVYYGSHNFSPAAWGRPVCKRVKTCKPSAFANIQILGCTLFVSNYELGVIFVVPPPEVRSKLQTSRGGNSTAVNETCIKSLDQLQLPFVTPAKKYQSTDQPATGLAMREALVQYRSLLGVEQGASCPLGTSTHLPAGEAKPWDYTDGEVDSEVDEVDEIERVAWDVSDIDTMWRQADIDCSKGITSSSR